MSNISSVKRSFLRSAESEFSLRVDFLVALLPVLVWSAVRFGIESIATVVLCSATAAVTDVLLSLFIQSKLKVPSLHIFYCGAVLGLTFYSGTQLPLVITSGVFCTLLIYLMGGASGSFLLAPIASRMIAIELLPQMLSKPDNLPVEVLFSGNMPKESVYELVLGMENGALGAVCAIAILLAMVYLWVRKAADFKASFMYIAVSFGLSFVLPAIVGRGVESAIYELLSGEILFASAFLLTDYASSSRSRVGKLVQGAICALLTFTLRRFGFAADAVYLSLIFVNLFIYIFSSAAYFIKEGKNEK